jgi:hypothetical protein
MLLRWRSVWPPSTGQRLAVPSEPASGDGITRPHPGDGGTRPNKATFLFRLPRPQGVGSPGRTFCSSPSDTGPPAPALMFCFDRSVTPYRTLPRVPWYPRRGPSVSVPSMSVAAEYGAVRWDGAVQ